MNTARYLLAVAIGLAVASPAPAQFGKIFDRAKDKLDRTKQKAKPVTDRAGRAADTFQPWSAEEEQQVGDATAAKLVAMFGLVEDPALVRYVNLVGLTVAQFAPRQLPFRFAILDTEIVGAYAIPGGYVFLTRPALAAMRNEAELAGALAHEMIHVCERHLERAVRSKNMSAWAAEEGQRWQTDERLRARADAFAQDLFTTGLSRDKEDQADEQGTLLAARAGYAASGLLEFLRTLATASADAANQRMFGQFLSTHPPFADRIAHLEPIAARAGNTGQTLQARFQAAVQH